MEKFVTRAARLNKAYDIELIERELECGEDDIIVRNHMMGICGSDKSFYIYQFPFWFLSSGKCSLTGT